MAAKSKLITLLKWTLFPHRFIPILCTSSKYDFSFIFGGLTESLGRLRSSNWFHSWNDAWIGNFSQNFDLDSTYVPFPNTIFLVFRGFNDLPLTAVKSRWIQLLGCSLGREFLLKVQSRFYAPFLSRYYLLSSEGSLWTVAKFTIVLLLINLLFYNCFRYTYIKFKWDFYKEDN